jgi:hypothetical protein
MLDFADAGSCSLENASLVRSHMLHYLFALKSTQPTLYKEAGRLLGALDVSQALAWSEDHLSGLRVGFGPGGSGRPGMRQGQWNAPARLGSLVEKSKLLV